MTQKLVQACDVEDPTAMQYETNNFLECPRKVGTRQYNLRKKRGLPQDVSSKKGWTEEHQRKLLRGHRKYGNRWAKICRRLRGWAPNTIKNKFYSTFRKVKHRLLACHTFLSQHIDFLETYYILSVMERFLVVGEAQDEKNGDDKNFIRQLVMDITPEQVTEYRTAIQERYPIEAGMKDVLAIARPHQRKHKSHKVEIRLDQTADVDVNFVPAMSRKLPKLELATEAQVLTYDEKAAFHALAFPIQSSILQSYLCGPIIPTDYWRGPIIPLVSTFDWRMEAPIQKTPGILKPIALYPQLVRTIPRVA